MLEITPQVVSITGTINQVTASSPNGNVTLSLPQDINTSSSPAFTGLTVSGLTVSLPVFTDGAKALTSAGTVPLNQGGTGQTTKTAAFDALSPMSQAGDIIYGGAAGTGTRLGIGGANTVLHGAASVPVYSAVVEADITLANNTTNNASLTKHGFLPILPGNPAQFLDGNGNYSTPAASVANSYNLTTFSGQTTVNVVHNFGTYPVVQVIDNSGNVLVPLTTTNNTLNDFTVTFSVSTSGSIISTVGSPQPQALTVASGNYGVLNTDRIIKVTASGATITLPTSVGNTGREFNIDNASTGNITVNTTSSQLIEGVLTQTIPSNNAMTVYSDGVGWRII